MSPFSSGKWFCHLGVPVLYKITVNEMDTIDRIVAVRNIRLEVNKIPNDRLEGVIRTTDIA
jgi:hypothetical protein